MKKLAKNILLPLAMIIAFTLVTAPAQAGYGTDLPALAARDYAKAQWPDEYSGFWVSYVTPPVFDEPLPDDARFHFAFTEDAEAKVEILRGMFPGVHNYLAVDHEFSMNELLAVHSLAAADLRAIWEGTLDAPGDPIQNWSVGIAERENRTRVGVPDATPEFKAWALDRWGPAAELTSEAAIPVPHGPLPIQPGDGVNPGDGPKQALDKKRKALVRKCNRAAKSKSVARKRFAKSKKCKRARRAVKTQTR